jgi:hypothetical protein
MRLDFMALLAPAPRDPEWEAEKLGWRCFVFGNANPSYRRGSRLRAAWQRGYDAAARSERSDLYML